jgi:hypothetical protein
VKSTLEKRVDLVMSALLETDTVVAYPAPIDNNIFIAACSLLT